MSTTKAFYNFSASKNDDQKKEIVYDFFKSNVELKDMVVPIMENHTNSNNIVNTYGNEETPLLNRSHSADNSMLSNPSNVKGGVLLFKK